MHAHVVETNAGCLFEAVRQIPKPRHICLEEGTLSEGLYEVLSPHARMAIFDCIEGWEDPHRRQSGLGQESPLNFERDHAHAA